MKAILKKLLTSLYQSGFQVKCVLRAFYIDQNLILMKSRQKNKQCLASDLLLSLSFLLKGKSHMSLGENSNFSLMLLVWEEKWILRHHVPKFWKCRVDLEYMVCICKCCHMDIASSEHHKNRTAHATKDCCLKRECNLTQGL